jgi:hypothetical protein
MSKPITLKRTVTIKAIVTEDFKKYLSHELNQSIKELEDKLQAVEDQGKQLISSLNKSGNDQQRDTIEQQIQLERQQQEQAKSDLEKRKEEVKVLELDSEFAQGTIDGFVGIKAGDNLYQKLGALEIIVKDGVVQEIRGESAAQ